MTDWNKANCKGIPINDFFPEGKGRTYVPRHIVIACSNCHIRNACLEKSRLDEGEQGIWAGMLPTERNRLPKEFRFNELPCT